MGQSRDIVWILPSDWYAAASPGATVIGDSQYHHTRPYKHKEATCIQTVTSHLCGSAIGSHSVCLFMAIYIY